MKCVMCNNKKDLKKTIQNVPYNECGMTNITIKNATVYHCDKCGESYKQYGNIVVLHEMLKEIILENTSYLTGAQAKFLRKQTGSSTKRFAEMLGIDDRSLMRWEALDKLSPQQTAQVKTLTKLIGVCREYNKEDLVKKTEKPTLFERIFLQPSANKFEASFA